MKPPEIVCGKCQKPFQPFRNTQKQCPPCVKHGQYKSQRTMLFERLRDRRAAK
jgi:predicted amidophosphoribosyltransferase